ncbi:carbon-nitrogen family hydrolase [Methylocaldum marinum]|uniref:Carbon-nitrogen family hydrolase n=1 Tax=Methylocaldum marinum TaxID=1432792 RepID=A0A250KZX2_9GAMM|nr:carbon-nitrogen hydrolase family protein [Methylocaldum marinum]BBA37044.1 carbon-nitrogen family hydrolase [Methylocaldum marinum]
MTQTLVAAVQLTSTPDVASNLASIGSLIERSADSGARLVVLPENVALMGRKETDKLEAAESDGSGPIQDFLAEAAAKNRIWLVGGTIPIRTPSGKVYAASPVYDDSGRRVARYDKIHLFDVDVPGSREQYRESNTIEPGNTPLVLDTPFGRLGVAVCYDLRFPELFRYLAAQGLDILALPSAFTAATGKAHWDVLVRARAVENLCYVVAANQGGTHPNGRETYGHSMVVDPWGSVLAQLDTEPGVVLAEVSRRRIEEVRTTFPALRHRRIGIDGAFSDSAG